MGKPKEYKDISYGIVSELMSASSSLHMYPDFREPPGNDLFLSDCEENVIHSLTHIRSALRMACAINSIREDLKDALIFLFHLHNEDSAKVFLRKVCKVFDINSGFFGEIDPADQRSWYYIKDEDYTIENAWNLWILECWHEQMSDANYEYIYYMEDEDDS